MPALLEELEERTTPMVPRLESGKQDDGDQDSGGKHGGGGGDTNDNKDDGHIPPGDPNPQKK
jgi:hypothetical protein